MATCIDRRTSSFTTVQMEHVTDRDTHVLDSTDGVGIELPIDAPVRFGRVAP